MELYTFTLYYIFFVFILFIYTFLGGGAALHQSLNTS